MTIDQACAALSRSRPGILTRAEALRTLSALDFEVFMLLGKEKSKKGGAAKGRSGAGGSGRDSGASGRDPGGFGEGCSFGSRGAQGPGGSGAGCSGEGGEANASGELESSFEGYNEHTPGDRTLLIPDPFAEIYIYRLEAKADCDSGEIGRYNCSSALFNSAWERFATHAGSVLRRPAGKWVLP